MDELEFYNGQLTGEQIDKRVVTVNCGTVSSIPHTVTNDKILASHEVIGARFGTPSAEQSTWRVSTSAGSLTIDQGTIRGDTTLVLYLAIPI